MNQNKYLTLFFTIHSAFSYTFLKKFCYLLIVNKLLFLYNEIQDQPEASCYFKRNMKSKKKSA